jgi:hypothetical protein
MLLRRILRFSSSNPVDKVLSQPQIQRVPLAPTDPRYEEDCEATGKYKLDTSQFQGNIKHLKLGKAQTLRVNNPYKYTHSDITGKVDKTPPKWGLFKQNEVGGSNIVEAGVLTVNANTNYVRGDKVRGYKAVIYFNTPNVMHRVPSVPTQANFEGNWVLDYLPETFSKEYEVGDDITFDVPLLRQFNFTSVQDAIRFCEVNGMEYSVEPMRTRRHCRKSYADNFKYKRPREN